jgi:hypothetical protein
MRVLGIDPGIRGALAIYDRSADFLECLDVPIFGVEPQHCVDPRPIWRWIDRHRPDFCFIELVTAMPSIPDVHGVRRGMGAASAMKFGDVVGSLRTVVMCCGLEFKRVVPRVWKKHHDLKGPDKELSRQKAIALLPGHGALFVRKKDEARAEASLIAMYGWHVMRSTNGPMP